MSDRVGGSTDGGGDSSAVPRTAGRPPADPLRDTMPWVADDDPLLKQLRDWRAEINSQTSPAASGFESPAPAPASARPATDAPGPRYESGPPPRGRHGLADDEGDRPPSSGSWALPGLTWPKARPSTLEEPVRPAVRRDLPPQGHARWNVLAPATPPAPAPTASGPALSPAELQQAQAMTVGFPALDLVPIGENENREVAIAATGLRKVFKDFTAVDGVSLTVHKGQIVALLGPNGAGKTTTVNMLCTLLKPDGGTAVVNGCDVVGDAAGVRRSIMLTGQFAALDEGLTGRENLVMFGRLLGLDKKAAKARADELLAIFGLEAAAGRKVGQYSGGMRRRIDIACGLVTEPKVVFLDEPTTGLDPRSRQDVWALVEQLRSAGVTVLLTTQYLEEADMLSDRIVVIDKGRVIAEGTSDELKAATGAAYCEVTPVHPAYLPRLRRAVADLLGPTAADIDAPDGTISVPAPNGPATLSEVLRRTEAAQIPLADVVLRRPSLDEVFLALTDPSAAASRAEAPKAAL